MAHQMVRRTVLNDLSGLQHDNAVETPDRREAMRDRDHGASSRQPPERLLNGFLGFTIERRRRFIQQKQRRVFQEGAGNRNAFWPPDSFMPRSPTIVANPCGSASTKSRHLAKAAAWMTSASVASGLPYRIFSIAER
jgi:hypothetical protein